MTDETKTDAKQDTKTKTAWKSFPLPISGTEVVISREPNTGHFLKGMRLTDNDTMAAALAVCHLLGTVDGKKPMIEDLEALPIPDGLKIIEMVMGDAKNSTALATSVH